MDQTQWEITAEVVMLCVLASDRRLVMANLILLWRLSLCSAAALEPGTTSITSEQGSLLQVIYMWLLVALCANCSPVHLPNCKDALQILPWLLKVPYFTLFLCYFKCWCIVVFRMKNHLRFHISSVWSSSTTGHWVNQMRWSSDSVFCLFTERSSKNTADVR